MGHYRQQLVRMRTQETNRRARCPQSTHGSIDAVLSCLKAEIAKVDKAIDQHIKAYEKLRERAEQLRSVPGVGPVLTSTLLAECPELGRIGPKPLASLMGVAPFAHDSGQYHGTRHIYGGRKRVRTILYMATVASLRWNPRLNCLLYTSPSPRDLSTSRMPSSA